MVRQEADAIDVRQSITPITRTLGGKATGEWSGDVEHVKIGRVTHIAGESGNEEDGYNYSIRPLAAEATPSPHLHKRSQRRRSKPHQKRPKNAYWI